MNVVGICVKFDLKLWNEWKIHTSSRVKAPKSVPYSTEISPEAPAPLDRYIYFAVRADIVTLYLFSNWIVFFVCENNRVVYGWYKIDEWYLNEKKIILTNRTTEKTNQQSNNNWHNNRIGCSRFSTRIWNEIL